MMTPFVVEACIKVISPLFLISLTIPTWEISPLFAVEKNNKSPGFASETSIFLPFVACSAERLGNLTSCASKTVITKPLQSKPDCVLPPNLYGVPKKSSASSNILFTVEEFLPTNLEFRFLKFSVG